MKDPYIQAEDTDIQRLLNLYRRHAMKAHICFRPCRSFQEEISSTGSRATIKSKSATPNSGSANPRPGGFPNPCCCDSWNTSGRHWNSFTLMAWFTETWSYRHYMCTPSCSLVLAEFHEFQRVHYL